MADDGTSAGTTLLLPCTGTDTCLIDLLTDINGTLFFINHDDAHGVELWKSDGTIAGTALVKDILPGEADSYRIFLLMSNGTLSYCAKTAMTIEMALERTGLNPGQ